MTSVRPEGLDLIGELLARAQVGSGETDARRSESSPATIILRCKDPETRAVSLCKMATLEDVAQFAAELPDATAGERHGNLCAPPSLADEYMRARR